MRNKYKQQLNSKIIRKKIITITRSLVDNKIYIWLIFIFFIFHTISCYKKARDSNENEIIIYCTKVFINQYSSDSIFYQSLPEIYFDFLLFNKSDSIFNLNINGIYDAAEVDKAIYLKKDSLTLELVSPIEMIDKFIKPLDTLYFGARLASGTIISNYDSTKFNNVKDFMTYLVKKGDLCWVKEKNNEKSHTNIILKADTFNIEYRNSNDKSI